jgi:hypothetical protein
MEKEFGKFNIGLRMPHGMIALDIDAYDGKPGAKSLAALEKSLGKLPPTFCSTSRGDGKKPGDSRIMYFWLPEEYRDYKMHDKPKGNDGGIEIIQEHHRHANVYPSTHVKTKKVYQWYQAADSTEEVAEDDVWFPEPSQAATLPVAWAEYLKDKPVGESTVKALDLRDEEAWAWLDKHRGSNNMCAITKNKYDSAVDAFAQSQIAGLYDEARTEILRIVNLVKGGHGGIDLALDGLKGLYIAHKTRHKRPGQEINGDLERMLKGAVNLVAAEMLEEGAPYTPCQCELIAEMWANGDFAQMGIKDPNAEDRALAEATMVAEKAAEKRINKKADRLANLQIATEGWTPPEARGSLAEQLDDPVPTIGHLVAGLIPETGIAQFTAQYKAGKTTLMVNLVKALVSNTPFLRHFDVNFPKGGVAIWNMEVAEATLNGWYKDIDIPEEELHRVHPLHLRGTGMNIEDQVVADWTVNWLIENEIKVWIIDPLSKLYHGEENSNTEYNTWWRALEDVTARAEVDVVILVHHTGHEAGGRARGASAMMGNPDVLIDYWHDGEHGKTPTGSKRYLRALGRDIELLQELTIDRDPATMELFVDLNGGSYSENKANGMANKVWSALFKRSQEEPDAKPLNQTALIQLAGGSASGNSSGVYRDGIATAVKKGWIKVEQVGNSKLHSLGDVSPVTEQRGWPEPQKEEEKPAPRRRRKAAAK